MECASLSISGGRFPPRLIVIAIQFYFRTVNMIFIMQSGLNGLVRGILLKYCKF
jgi:hypothetical protein